MVVNPREIRLNAGKDLLGFTCTEFTIKPLDWIAGVLAVIAPILTMTQRHDVIRRIPAAFSYWYPVVLRQRMPQSDRAITDSARVTKIVEGALPIGIRKSTRQIQLPSSTSLKYSALPFWMSTSVSSDACYTLFWMFLRISYVPLTFFVGVLFTPSLATFVSCFPCALIILAVLIPYFVSTLGVVSLLIRLPKIGMSFLELICIRFNAVWMHVAILFFSLFLALATKILESIGRALVFSKLRGEFVLSTLVTALNSIHDAFLSSNSVMSSAAAGIKRRSGATLADLSIIPRKGMIK